LKERIGYDIINISNGKRGGRLDTEKISWHPGFIDGLQAEFEKYGEALTFFAEYQLSKEPLRIDVVVIKKQPNVVIDKNLGQIFRGHNIFEYKSPTDYIAVADFQKTCAYVWLYAAETGADIGDMTLSLVTTDNPRALFEYCAAMGYAIEKRWDGVYYVTGCFVPIQVIVNGKLDRKDNLWLRSLRGDMSAEDLGVVLTETVRRGYVKKLQGYLSVILTANAEALEGVRNMQVSQELRDVILKIGIIDDVLIEKKEEGKEEGAVLVLSLLRQGYTAEQLQEMVDSGTLPDTHVIAE
jgi:hypothetical protein